MLTERESGRSLEGAQGRKGSGQNAGGGSMAREGRTLTFYFLRTDKLGELLPRSGETTKLAYVLEGNRWKSRRIITAWERVLNGTNE